MVQLADQIKGVFTLHLHEHSHAWGMYMVRTFMLVMYNPMPCTDVRLWHNALLHKEWIVYYGMLYAAIIQCLNDGITAY